MGEGPDAGDAEISLDMKIQLGLNWGIISQAHSTTLGHVDTAGVYTAVVILTGVKYWAIRKTTPDRKDKHKPTDLDWFVDLTDRDIKDLPGGETEWVAVVLHPGDILYVFRPFTRWYS